MQPDQFNTLASCEDTRYIEGENWGRMDIDHSILTRKTPAATRAMGVSVGGLRELFPKTGAAERWFAGAAIGRMFAYSSWIRPAFSGTASGRRIRKSGGATTKQL